MSTVPSVTHVPAGSPARPPLPRLFLAEDLDLWDAARAAHLDDRFALTPLTPVAGPRRTASARDTVVLRAEHLPTDALELAAALAALAPARVLLVVGRESPAGIDVVGQALRLGAADVLTGPVRPDELRLRLEVLAHRPATTVRPAASVRELRDVLHQLTNVLAALRLTGFVVGRLGDRSDPSAATDDGDDRPTRLADPHRLAERIEREVDEAVRLVEEVETMSAPAPPQEGGSSWD